MKCFNPSKILSIQIESNDNSNSNGHPVWRVISGERKHTLSRNADGSDFDWMSEKQIKDFEKGKFNFSITASQASEFFNYIY